LFAVIAALAAIMTICPARARAFQWSTIIGDNSTIERRRAAWVCETTRRKCHIRFVSHGH